MKKLLIYCHHFYPMNTGYSNAFQNLINSVLDNFDDIEITVVTPCALENKNELNRKRLEIIRLAPRTNIRKLRYFINDWYHAKYVSGLFKEKCFDLLLIETFDQAFFINCLDKDLFDKVLVRIHSTSETEYTIFNDSFTHRVRKFIIQKSLMKKVINIASTNSFHIEFAKKHYLKDNLLSIANKNFFVIPNAVKEIDRSLINFEKKGKLIYLPWVEWIA